MPTGSDTGIRHGSQDDEVRLEAILRGRVQGVGFRWFTVARATALGCTGWVANRPDGSVHVVAEAGRGVLEQLLAELREGPEGARVDAVAASWGTATGTYAGFGVRSGGHAGD